MTGCATAPVPADRSGGTSPQRVVALAIADGDFEAETPAGRNCPTSWICRVHADSASFRISSDATTAAQGRRSLRIEKVGTEPWATVLQSIPAREAAGHRVRFSLAMRMEGVAGVGAGPWIIAFGPGGMIEHRASLDKGTRDWQRAAVEMELPGNAEHIEVGAILEADGRIWIDDARLEVVEASPRR
jgi:hypothetical protein